MLSLDIHEETVGFLDFEQNSNLPGYACLEGDEKRIKKGPGEYPPLDPFVYYGFKLIGIFQPPGLAGHHFQTSFALRLDLRVTITENQVKVNSFVI